MARRFLRPISDSDSWHGVLSDDRQSGPKLASFSRSIFFPALFPDPILWASEPKRLREQLASALCALRSALCARRFVPAQMCSLLRLCQTVLVCLATAWPSMPVHSELSVPPLQAQAMESHATTASSANRHMTTVWCGQSGFSRSLTARLPPCPYCALACVAP